ncbi:MAG: hypothetical protein KR126chlam5_01404 [Candidatus Anoxychlamydiales bacterium]|nr:hypothetical protein [Candidatus Anoxychlamydiales bacterium]
MTTSVKNSDNRSFFQRGTDLLSEKVYGPKRISQSELISKLEPNTVEKTLSIEQLREKTNEAVKIYIQRSTTFAVGKFLYKWCNDGKEDVDVDRKLLYIVRDLSKCNSPGFFKIRSVMNRYFKKLSFFRMAFFYCTFISWVPNLYIRKTVFKILKTSRKELKNGKNLPDLGSRVVKTANSYLANYNNAVDRFRDDETNPTGDRDKYLKEHLQHPKILGYDSVEVLNSEFAKAASKEKMRPDFSPLSDIVKKIQLLEFKILNKVPKVLLLPLQAVTLIMGAIPYILAKLLEIPPNVIINIFHKRMIESYAPSILEDTLKAVNRSGFTHAINCFLCKIIDDAFIEMNKSPYDKTTKEVPRVVDKALSADIKKFSELLFTLITRESYQTKDELKRIQKNGLDTKSDLVKFLKLFKSEYIDRVWVKYFFVDKALHPNIIELFNFLFGQPEKFEEYLCNLIELLNVIYDDEPDTTTSEGSKLLSAQQAKQTTKEKLVNKLIKKTITDGTEDGIHEVCKVLSKNQNKDLILAYRKVKEKTLEMLPGIQLDARNLLISCKELLQSISPLNSKTPAKEDIELAKNDLKNLFIVIKNVIPKENGPTQRAMEKHLRKFKENEKILLDSLNQVDNLHDEIEQLKSLSKELENLKSLFNSKYINIKKIKESLDVLKTLKLGSKFDKMIDEYKFLSDQFEKIQTHEKYISTMQEVLKTTFFKSGLLLELAKAQKEYLNSPNSISKERRVKALNEKIIRSLNLLTPIADDSDISELKDVIRKIYICPDSKKITTVHNKAKVLFKRKLSKHASLLEDEKVMLKTDCFEKCKSTIKKHENAFSRLFKDNHQSIMQNAQNFSDSLKDLKEIVKDIDKKKQLGLNGITIIQSAIASGSALASTAAAYLSHPYLSGALATTAVIFGASIKLRPFRWTATNAAVPLAEDSAENAQNVLINSVFNKGLAYSYMKDFINFAKKSKK